MYFFLKNQAKGCGCGCGVWGCEGARDGVHMNNI